MSIVKVQCPECGKALQAPERYRGKKIRCPGCRQPLIVPEVRKTDRIEVVEPTPPVPQPPVFKEPQKAARSDLRFAAAALGLASLLAALAWVLLSPSGSIPEAKTSPPSIAPRAEQPGESSHAALHAWKPPFKYKILKEESGNSWGQDFHSFEIETSVDVAKSATEKQVHSIWSNALLPKARPTAKVLARFTVDTPGASAWAIASRTPKEIFKLDAGWDTDVSIYDDARDPLPYHFVREIDRTVTWQRGMIITLPAANEMVEKLGFAGFSLGDRSVSHVSLSNTSQRIDISITPESIDISSSPNMLREESEFWRAVELALRPLGIAEEALQKVKTVIGSPAYFKAEQPGGGNAMSEDWNIGSCNFEYDYFGKGFHRVYVSRRRE